MKNFNEKTLLDILLCWQLDKTPEIFNKEDIQNLKEVGIKENPLQVARELGLENKFKKFLQNELQLQNSELN